MKPINVYVINLKKDVERKIYMEKTLSLFRNCNIEFVEAVYGRELSDVQINESFDIKKSYKRYGRNVNLGEIGCTLSHMKCYKKLVDSPHDYALILEDDVTFLRNINDIGLFIDYINVPYPLIVFLSADYWYYKKKYVSKDYSIASVFDAVGAYAYLINKSAAQLILNKNNKSSHVADHWALFRHQGVKLKAVYPYIVDANIEGFVSTIKQGCFGEIRRNMSLISVVNSSINGLIKKLLLARHMFVSKIRK